MKQDGFILLSVMILLATSALLVLSLMNDVWIYSNACQQSVGSHRALHAIETIATQLDVNQLTCRDTQVSPNQLISHVKKGQGCVQRTKQGRYRYRIADLGLYPCLPISHYSSHQFYITIMALQSPYQILQLRVAKRSNEVAVCQLLVHHPIGEGMMTWRLFE